MHRALVALLVVLAFGPAMGAPAGAVAVDDPTMSTSTGLHEEAIDCEYPIEVEDADGETVTVEERPDEIVVLGANVAQQLWDMGERDRVTGLPKFAGSAYLEDQEDKADVSDEFGSPINEKVVGLEPDLVLAPSIIQDVSGLREAGLTVYRSAAERSIEDVYADIERTGQLVGSFEAAAELVADMKGTVQAVEDATADEEPVSVLYWMGGGFTAGDGTVEDDMISIAGGENIAAGAVDFYGEISAEVIQDEDPEYVVIGEGMPIPDELSDTTAVQEDQIVRVNTDYISQPGPRMTQPILTMAEAFHPDAVDVTAVQDAMAEPNHCESADETDTDDGDDGTGDGDDGTGDGDDGTGDSDDATGDDETADDEGADDDGTGFTPGVVVSSIVALSAALILGRRLE